MCLFFLSLRFTLFRKVLDGEMRDATKHGIDLKTKKEERSEISVEEEELLWQKGLLGAKTAECLLNTMHFYNGTLSFWVKIKRASSS